MASIFGDVSQRVNLSEIEPLLDNMNFKSKQFQLMIGSLLLLLLIFLSCAAVVAKGPKYHAMRILEGVQPYFILSYFDSDIL